MKAPQCRHKRHALTLVIKWQNPPEKVVPDDLQSVRSALSYILASPFFQQSHNQQLHDHALPAAPQQAFNAPCRGPTRSCRGSCPPPRCPDHPRECTARSRKTRRVPRTAPNTLPFPWRRCHSGGQPHQHVLPCHMAPASAPVMQPDAAAQNTVKCCDIYAIWKGCEKEVEKQLMEKDAGALV